jgi:AcrR family transcriptional regulator
MANQSEKSPADRLREAMAALNTDSDSGAPTVSALCEAANVSRTALYRYHTDVLEQLRALQRRRRRVPSLDRCAMQKLRDENLLLRRQLEQLAALVDHYFAAWQEINSLLQRRESELAELRKSTKAKVVPLRV